MYFNKKSGIKAEIYEVVQLEGASLFRAYCPFCGKMNEKVVCEHPSCVEDHQFCKHYAGIRGGNMYFERKPE